MAKGGRSEFNIDFSEYERNMNVLLHHVNTGSKKATTEAAIEILDDSLSEVPRDTEALAHSAYYEVEHYGNRGFSATIGYGKGNPINPKTGRRVSEYMVAVHEDLSAYHDTGKAKFLEDPVRKYQAKFAGKIASVVMSETGM